MVSRCRVMRWMSRDWRRPATSDVVDVLHWCDVKLVLLVFVFSLWRSRGRDRVSAANALSLSSVVGIIRARVVVAEDPSVPRVKHGNSPVCLLRLEERVTASERLTRPKNTLRRNARVALATRPSGSHRRAWNRVEQLPLLSREAGAVCDVGGCGGMSKASAKGKKELND